METIYETQMAKRKIFINPILLITPTYAYFEGQYVAIARDERCSLAVRLKPVHKDCKCEFLPFLEDKV